MLIYFEGMFHPVRFDINHKTHKLETFGEKKLFVKHDCLTKLVTLEYFLPTFIGCMDYFYTVRLLKLA